MGNDYPNNELNYNFFETMENKNDEYLVFFNEHTHFFIIPNTNKRETQKYSVIDRQLLDRYGKRTINIELKIRTKHINFYNGVFIEPKKWEALKKDYQEKGIIPLYINFFQTHDNVIIFDLRQWFDKKITPQNEYVNIINKGYHRIDKKELRYKLPQRDGFFYEFDQEQQKYIRKW